MSTAYQQAPASYGSHGIHGYPVALAATASHTALVADSRIASGYRSSLSVHHQQQQRQKTGATDSHYGDMAPAVRPLHQQSDQKIPSPGSRDSSKVSLTGRSPRQRDLEKLVFHSLNIPRCISATGDSLADFAAQPMDDLKQAETIRSTQTDESIPRLAIWARPHEQFRKWVYSVLSTTQVTQNVILLALLFTYRLKMSTPTIKGRGGSEYRLLTVALMLANKFLDDNTYTNKTWAEVSSFAVQEIHVMEVEFLSNMRYNLLVSAAEWLDWVKKLASFHNYYEQALRLPSSPLAIPPPNGHRLSSPLVSPTSAVFPGGSRNRPKTPSPSKPVSPSSNYFKTRGTHERQDLISSLSPAAAMRPLGLTSTSRKRSALEEPLDHPAKRAMSAHQQPALPGMGASFRHTESSGTGRLPVPQLTIVTGLTQSQPPISAVHGLLQSATPSVRTPHPLTVPTQSMVSLPPLQSGARAMSTVYPSASCSTTPTTSIPDAGTPNSLPLPPAPFVTHPGQSAMLGYGTPGKHHGAMALTPFTSSPLAEHFPGSGMHTPISNSPSFYLQQRNSPYRPIRHVNTLLCPPPSASLHQYHINVTPTQMHYQPLGRRHDVRTGVVPEFVVFNHGH